jgi:hypothetical protein
MATKFQTHQQEFEKETGLDPKTNIDTYIQFFQAKLLEELLTQQNTKLQQLIDAVNNRF